MKIYIDIEKIRMATCEMEFENEVSLKLRCRFTPLCKEVRYYYGYFGEYVTFCVLGYIWKSSDGLYREWKSMR